MHSRLRFILVFALVSMVNPAIGQRNILIKGTSENAAGKKIELIRLADQISKLEQIVDSSTISDDGCFNLHAFATYPTMVTLQVENYSQSFYVEPGKDYDIHIPTFDWTLDEKQNVFLDPVALPVVFKSIPPTDINIQIDSLDRVINRFISDNYFYFDNKFKPSVHYFDSLENIVNAIYADGENDFVERYKTYQLATIKFNMGLESRKKLINKYIKNKPILYYDENYMSLFNDLYANSISKGTKDISVYRLAHWVYNLDLDTYIDSIGIDPLLRNEQIRELAALQALKESYYNFRYYDAEMVIKMIEKISERTKFLEHKTIAINILSSIQQREVGTKAKTYTLPDVNKEMVSLGNTKGKWVYMSFVRVGEAASQGEIETIAHLKDTVISMNDSVIFITIDCDREFQKMFHFLKNNKRGNRYNWTWLHFDSNYDMLDYYGVNVFPWFVLINPKGELQYDVTPAPSTGFLLNAPWINKTKQNNRESELFKY